MPSRDHDPSRDEHPFDPRWGHEAGRDPARRDPQRRYGQPSAFGRGRETEGRAEPSGNSGATFTQTESAERGGGAFGAAHDLRAAGPAGPGGSYGSPGGGRASGSQAYGQGPRDEPRPSPMEPREYRHDPRYSAPPGPYDSPEAHKTDERRIAHAEPGRGRHWQGGLSSERPAMAHPGLERDDTQFDADYRQWRDEQMRMLDRDYAQWRQERYRKFAEEFSQWRSQRLIPSPASGARPGAEAGPGSLGELSPLGTPGTHAPLHGEERERSSDPERQPRSGGGLLGSLLGTQGDPSKPRAQ